MEMFSNYSKVWNIGSGTTNKQEQSKAKKQLNSILKSSMQRLFRIQS